MQIPVPRIVCSLWPVLGAAQRAPSRTLPASSLLEVGYGRASPSIWLIDDPLSGISSVLRQDWPHLRGGTLLEQDRRSSGHAGAPWSGKPQIKSTSPKRHVTRERS